MTHATYRLTAKNRDQLRDLRLVIEYGLQSTFTFLCILAKCSWKEYALPLCCGRRKQLWQRHLVFCWTSGVFLYLCDSCTQTIIIILYYTSHMQVLPPGTLCPTTSAPWLILTSSDNCWNHISQAFNACWFLCFSRCFSIWLTFVMRLRSRFS